MNSEAQKSYWAKSRSELNKIFEEKSSYNDVDYQLKGNNALVTIFKDGSGIIFPNNVGSDEGVYFENIKYVRNMIDSGVYPVKGDGSFWEAEKSRVLNFQESIPYYLDQLSEILNFKVELNSDLQYLKSLSEVLNSKLKNKKKNNYLYMYTSIYVGEMIRLKTNADWKLHIDYTLNLYYTPELVKDNSFCTHWGYVIGRLEIASIKPVEIEELIIDAGTFYPFKNRDYLK